MLNGEGFIQGPGTVLYAPADTAKPALTDATYPNYTAPAGWNVLGIAGDESITEDGIAYSIDDSTNETYGLGSTLPLYAYTEQETHELSFDLHDYRPEILALLAGNTTSVQAAQSGVPGTIRTNLQRGLTPALRAFLLVVPSPYNVDRTAQIYLPRGYVKARGESTFSKSGATMIPATICALRSSPVFEAVNAVAL